MKKLIKLNSSEWCDLIFDNKNKAYGAYEHRQNSWKYHVISLAIIVALVVFITFLPSILGSIKAENKIFEGGYDETHILVDVNEKPEIEVVIPKDPLPEVPKLKEAIKFTPPVMVDESEINEDNEMKTVDEVFSNKGIVGKFTVENGSTDPRAIDPNELARLNNIVERPEPKDKGPIQFAEVMPSYPGGDGELAKFIGRNLKYPVDAQEIGVQGKVIIRFVVTKEGKIDDVRIMKGIHPSCDKEAVRVVKSMPRWIAGKQNGTPVAVYFTLPVVYRLKQG